MGWNACACVCVRVFVSFTCAAGRSLAHRVSQVAVTDEGSLSVLTVPTQADVWVQLTLVNI